MLLTSWLPRAMHVATATAFCLIKAEGKHREGVTQGRIEDLGFSPSFAAPTA